MPIAGIRHALARGGEEIRHRVLDAALALQQDERGERGGIRIVRRQLQVQRNRAIGALGLVPHERQLLPLRSGGDIQAQLSFEDGIGASLERQRVVDVADAGVGARDVAHDEQRFAAERADAFFPHLQRAEMRLEGLLIVARRAIHVGEVGQDAGQARMIAAEQALADGQRPAVRVDGRRIILALTSHDPEVLQRRGDEQTLAAEDRFADLERSLEQRFSCRVVIPRSQDVSQIVEERCVEERSRLVRALHGLERIALDLFGLLQVARALAQIRERHERQQIPRMRGPDRTFEQRQGLTYSGFSFEGLACPLVEQRDPRSGHRGIGMRRAPGFVERSDGALVEIARSRVVLRFQRVARQVELRPWPRRCRPPRVPTARWRAIARTVCAPRCTVRSDRVGARACAGRAIAASVGRRRWLPAEQPLG